MDLMLQFIITDETLVRHDTPETKEQSEQSFSFCKDGNSSSISKKRNYPQFLGRNNYLL